MGIFQITILVNLQGIKHWSLYESNGYWILAHWLTVSTILFGGVNHLGLATAKNTQQVSTWKDIITS